MRARLLLWIQLAVTFIAITLWCPGQTVNEGRGKDIRFRGPVFALSKDSRDRVVQVTIKVNQSQIDVDVSSWTQVTVGRGFPGSRSDLALGDFLQVNGYFTTAGRIVAQTILIENRDFMDLEGTVQSASTKVLRVNGIDFNVVPESSFRSTVEGAGSAADVKVGDPVRIRSMQKDGNWMIREMEYGVRSVESAPIRFQGTVQKVEGDLIRVDVGVRGVLALVAIDRQTVTDGYLRVGLLIEIEGQFVPGTSLVKASRIVVDANANQNIFDDVQGTYSGVSIEAHGIVTKSTATVGGAQQVLIGELVVKVDGRTVLKWDDDTPASLQDLAGGLFIEVVGTRLADRSIQAGKVVIHRPEDDGSDEEEDDSRNDDGAGDDSGETGGNSEDPDVGGGGDSGGNGEDPGEGDDGSGSGSGDPTAELVTLEGKIVEIGSGSSGAMGSIVVGDTSVHFVGSTQFKTSAGGEADSSTLSIGMEVVVEGVAKPDGSIEAKSITIKS